MSKYVRKAVAVMLAMFLVFSTSSVAFAKEMEDEQIPLSIRGLERFLHKSDAGMIEFDVEAALSSGYSQAAVFALEEHIAEMNQLALTANGYIDDTYTLTVYVPATRASGESKVVTHWYGLTEIYMNSDEAEELIDLLGDAGSTATWGGVVAFLLGKFGNTLSGVCTITGAVADFYVRQVKAAAEPGTGIIMNIQTDMVTNAQSIWFVSQ